MWALIDTNYLILKIFLNIIWDTFWQKIRSKFLPSRPEKFNFHLWCPFFSDIHKIDNFQQQKQLLLFSDNMTPKVLPPWWVLLGAPPHAPETQKVKNGDFLKILKNPKMSNFSTFFENRISMACMLTQRSLIWSYNFFNIISETLFGRNFGRNFCPRARKNSIFICGAHFFQIFTKSTIFSNKNNHCCFQATWPPKCCYVVFCCCDPPHGPTTAPNSKKRRFWGNFCWK